MGKGRERDCEVCHSTRSEKDGRGLPFRSRAGRVQFEGFQIFVPGGQILALDIFVFTREQTGAKFSTEAFHEMLFSALVESFASTSKKVVEQSSRPYDKVCQRM